MNCHYLYQFTAAGVYCVWTNWEGGKTPEVLCVELPPVLFQQHNVNKRENYTVMGWTGAVRTEAIKAEELTTSHLLQSYESHTVMDVSKSLHSVFDQGAFKDTDLVVERSLTPSHLFWLSYQCISSCQTQSGQRPNNKFYFISLPF